MGSRSKMMSSRPRGGTWATGKRKKPAKIGRSPIVSEVSRKNIKRQRLAVLRDVLGAIPKAGLKRFKVKIFDGKCFIFYRGNEI